MQQKPGNPRPGRGRHRNERKTHTNSKRRQKYAALPVNALRFIAERALLAKELFTSPEAPLRVKALLTGMLIYIISPIDLIPDMIPLLGITDDIALLIMGWNYAEGFVTPQMRAKVDAILQRWG
ncbi:MAG: YkvA family protein [Thermodesulfobacteriota bacterium]